MRVLATCLLCLMSPAVFAASLNVTFINPGYQGERFWDMVSSTMQAAADDLDIELEILFAERDRHLMQSLAARVLERKRPPDYLVLVNEEQHAVELLEQVEQRGVDVLFLLNGPSAEQRQHTGIPGEHYRHWVGVIEPDNFAAGARMARALLAAAPERPRPLPTLALLGDTLTPASINRNGGMLDVLIEDPRVRLDRLLTAHWNQEEARALTAGYLRWLVRRNETPALIWAANDPIAIGAIEALQHAGFAPGDDVLVVGLNWSPEGIQRVARGELLLTDGGHFLAGAWAMVMLRDLADATIEVADASIRFPMAALDARDVALYGEQLASPDWSRIDFSRFRYANAGYDFSPLRALEMLMEAPQ
ncbi:monosaccharide ABC transporter substrate-binding protein, CUT2 family [Franzmannia pantelleriensis]|uniref:Monosaccharide ABC transporter substrate-binding protein, CUT2 family n=1 Tax=Franzmannia pantelleriensis TaxID=48727 RepID=A0A1G9EZX0_9GAMM|nr:ABC transporter substrate-binding protein [Halomonas pantelleriensis]SDK81583.1 monosaccharide ABC transporter substrate-binding protein, CUT2 family [Halomonas pantelleriensis]